MSLRLLALCALASGACVAPAVRADYYPSGPPIAFEDEPGLVQVEPGIAVVPDIGAEVFYADGFYWNQWNGSWYRSGDWRGGWEIAPPPPRIIGLPHGHYRNWHSGPMIRPGRSVVVRPPEQRFRSRGEHMPPGRMPQRDAVAPRGPVVAPNAATRPPGRTVTPQARPYERAYTPHGRTYVPQARPNTAAPPPNSAPAVHRPAPTPAPTPRPGMGRHFAPPPPSAPPPPRHP